MYALKFHANEIMIRQSSVCFSLQCYILTLIKLICSFLTITWNSIINGMHTISIKVYRGIYKGKCTLYLSLILLMYGYVVSDISLLQDWRWTFLNIFPRHVWKFLYYINLGIPCWVLDFCAFHFTKCCHFLSKSVNIFIISNENSHCSTTCQPLVLLGFQWKKVNGYENMFCHFTSYFPAYNLYWTAFI